MTRDEIAELEQLQAAEMAHVVRPASENGGEYWNANAEVFTYPPAFGYPKVEGADRYEFIIVDNGFHRYAFAAPTPNEPLTGIWTKLDTGLTMVFCHGLDKGGRSVGLAGRSCFWKAAPFKPGAYPGAKRPYAESAALIYDYVFNLPSTRFWLEHGRPDPGYILNCYPTKIHASLISAMVRYAGAVPEKAAEALRLARLLADYLIADSEKPGTPLAGFPPTYEKRAEHKFATAGKYEGQMMLIYPVAAGNAYFTLFHATGDRRYFDAAVAVADRYAALQGEDGSWFLKVYLADGRPVNPNRCLPVGIAEFLETAYAETGDARYRAVADRAFAFLEQGPLRDWNWEGQFEDVEPTAKYVNLTKHPACETAIYLARRFPGDTVKMALARELLRFAEDQFVFWERPCRTDGTGIRTNDGRHHRDDVTADYLKWLDFPSVAEQYRWYIPIDASNAKLINTYLALYRVTGSKLDLAKARTLGDTLTRVQLDSGRIPTQLAEYNLLDAGGDWVNCMLAAARALENLAAEDGK